MVYIFKLPPTHPRNTYFGRHGKMLEKKTFSAEGTDIYVNSTVYKVLINCSNILRNEILDACMPLSMQDNFFFHMWL
jgi:hypothetical protein